MDKISDVIMKKALDIQKEWISFQKKEITATEIATEVATKSQAAIMGGRESTAWRTYMELFVGNDPTNIDRLVPPKTAPDPDPDREKARVYLVRNGMCSEGTTPTTVHTVEQTLD